MPEISAWLASLALIAVLVIALYLLPAGLARLDRIIELLNRLSEDTSRIRQPQPVVDTARELLPHLEEISERTKELVEVVEATAIRPGEIVDITTRFTGTVKSWHRNPGDYVFRKDRLLEFETDRFAVYIVAPISGVLQDVLVPAGTSVAERTVLGTIIAQRSPRGAA